MQQLYLVARGGHQLAGDVDVDGAVEVADAGCTGDGRFDFDDVISQGRPSDHGLTVVVGLKRIEQPQRCVAAGNDRDVTARLDAVLHERSADTLVDLDGGERHTIDSNQRDVRAWPSGVAGPAATIGRAHPVDALVVVAVGADGQVLSSRKDIARDARAQRREREVARA